MIQPYAAREPALSELPALGDEKLVDLSIVRGDRTHLRAVTDLSRSKLHLAGSQRSRLS